MYGVLPPDVVAFRWAAGWQQIPVQVDERAMVNFDALYNGNIRLEQIWLPDIKINYNFSSVSRYDRCVNCHRSIDATAAGSATEPAYPAIPRDQRVREIVLATPEEAPKTEAEEGKEAPEVTLASVYGFTLAPRGQMEVVDGGQVVDLEPVFAGRKDGGDLGPILGCEVDLVGIRSVGGSYGRD